MNQARASPIVDVVDQVYDDILTFLEILLDEQFQDED